MLAMTTSELRRTEPMIKLPSCLRGRTAQRGMTLIEILVAIVVLSIGLLGLAWLQLKGLQVGQGSTYRWQAAMLAEDIADRMRSDRPSALAGNYSGTFAAGATSTSGPLGTQSAMNDWLARLATLPSGNTIISAPAGAAGNQVTITIAWTDTRANAGAGATGARASSAAPGAFTLQTEF
jgi:type IV pilus assembly protein PilV